MLCDKCKKNPATTHVHTVINGVVVEKNLCSYCAAEDYVGGQGSIVNMLASMFGESLAHRPPEKGLRCPCCGAAFAEIAERGKAGCPQCYSTFKNQLLPSIQRLHGKTKHIGKVPANASEEMKKSAKIDKLKESLKEAIAAENFEQAALLRDEIRQLEA